MAWIIPVLLLLVFLLLTRTTRRRSRKVDDWDDTPAGKRPPVGGDHLKNATLHGPQGS